MRVLPTVSIKHGGLRLPSSLTQTEFSTSHFRPQEQEQKMNTYSDVYLNGCVKLRGNQLIAIADPYVIIKTSSYWHISLRVTSSKAKHGPRNGRWMTSLPLFTPGTLRVVRRDIVFDSMPIPCREVADDENNRYGERRPKAYNLLLKLPRIMSWNARVLWSCDASIRRAKQHYFIPHFIA